MEEIYNIDVSSSYHRHEFMTYTDFDTAFPTEKRLKKCARRRMYRDMIDRCITPLT